MYRHVQNYVELLHVESVLSEYFIVLIGGQFVCFFCWFRLVAYLNLTLKDLYGKDKFCLNCNCPLHYIHASYFTHLIRYVSYLHVHLRKVENS